MKTKLKLFLITAILACICLYLLIVNLELSDSGTSKILLYLWFTLVFCSIAIVFGLGYVSSQSMLRIYRRLKFYKNVIPFFLALNQKDFDDLCSNMKREEINEVIRQLEDEINNMDSWQCMSSKFGRNEVLSLLGTLQKHKK